jgi:hypothetical protein
MIWKRSIYTVVTPLPPTVSRETAVAMLHSHGEMIELNPLVIRHEKCKPPPSANSEEFHCIWYELTDRITYLPGIKGQISYKACFHDLPRGLQTHVYAPAGLDIKEKWSIGGNEPGEEREVIELGLGNLGVPREGLYLREDIDMNCNMFLTGFVKKTLNKAHGVLVERLVVKADLTDDRKARDDYHRNTTSTPTSSLRVTSPVIHHKSHSSMSDGRHSFADSTATARDEHPDAQHLQSIAELPAYDKTFDTKSIDETKLVALLPLSELP